MKGIKIVYNSYQKQPSTQQSTVKNNFIVAYTTGFNRTCTEIDYGV
jgi:hypothetical protein